MKLRPYQLSDIGRVRDAMREHPRVLYVAPTGSVDSQGDSHLNRIRKKYGDVAGWSHYAVRRLQSWNFNTLAEYSVSYAFPGNLRDSHTAGESGNMPFMLMIRPAVYSLRNQHDYAPAPVKDVIAGTDPAVYRGWRGNALPDVFDPNFQAYAEGLLRAMPRQQLESPWLIGIATDDSDNIVGFGPGPEVPAERLHPHIAWLVLASDFEQKENKKLNVSYRDSKLYS